MHLPASHIEPELQGTAPLAVVRQLLDRLVAAGEIAAEELPAMLAPWSDAEQMELGAYQRWAYPTLSSEFTPQTVAVFGRSRAGVNFGAVDELPAEFVFLCVIPALKFAEPTESEKLTEHKRPHPAWTKQWVRYNRWRHDMEPEAQRENALRACTNAEQIAVVLAKRQPATARKQHTIPPRVHAGIASLFPVDPADFIIETL